MLLRPLIRYFPPACMILPTPLPYQKLDSQNYDQKGKSKDNRNLTRSWQGWISNNA